VRGKKGCVRECCAEHASKGDEIIPVRAKAMHEYAGVFRVLGDV
jgi:hypothetical protein